MGANDKTDHFILITGFMGSGKSTILNEFIREEETQKFVPPPVKAEFRGMKFEFYEDIFALERDTHRYNFYELDAPTINKWTQFIEIADALIIVHNVKKSDYMNDPSKFIDRIKSHKSDSSEIFFILNNCEDYEKGKKIISQTYDLTVFDQNKIHFRQIPPGNKYLSDKYGPRIDLDISLLIDLYNDVINTI